MKAAFFGVWALAIVVAGSLPADALKLDTPAKRVVDLIQIRRASDGWNRARAEPTSQDCGRR
jgi:hypothetical protein